MKQVKIETLSDAINKYMDLADSNKDALFDKEEIEELIKLISKDSEYSLAAPYIKLLLLDNYELLHELTNKNNEFYKDPKNKLSYWDLKKLLEILEHNISDKVQFKEETNLDDERFNELLKSIINTIPKH